MSNIEVEHKLVNLTSHEITEVTSGTIIPRSGIVARVKTDTKIVSTVGACPIFKTEISELMGLPAPVTNTKYIVSALCLNAVPADRTDVIATGNPQRDARGVIIGCVGFRQK